MNPLSHYLQFPHLWRSTEDTTYASGTDIFADGCAKSDCRDRPYYNNGKYVCYADTQVPAGAIPYTMDYVPACCKSTCAGCFLCRSHGVLEVFFELSENVKTLCKYNTQTESRFEFTLTLTPPVPTSLKATLTPQGGNSIAVVVPMAAQGGYAAPMTLSVTVPDLPALAPAVYNTVLSDVFAPQSSVAPFLPYQIKTRYGVSSVSGVNQLHIILDTYSQILGTVTEYINSAYPPTSADRIEYLFQNYPNNPAGSFQPSYDATKTRVSSTLIPYPSLYVPPTQGYLMFTTKKKVVGLDCNKIRIDRLAPTAFGKLEMSYTELPPTGSCSINMLGLQQKEVTVDGISVLALYQAIDS